MSFYTNLPNQFFKIATLALFAGLGMGNTIQALPCEGGPGDLTAINKGDLLSSSTVNVVESYECLVNTNPPYGEDELRCFVVTGGIGNATFSQSDNKVYRVLPDGSLTEIQTGWNTGNDGENLGASIADIAPFKCEGECYIAVVENPSGAILIYSVLSDGTLQFQTLFNTGGPGLTTVDAFECNGVCYIITGGTDAPFNNLLLDFIPPNSIGANVNQNYDGGAAPINDLVAFECESIWWVVTGSDMSLGNNLYQLNPCLGSDPLVNVQPGYAQDEVIALTAYFWNCQWYISTLQHQTNPLIVDRIITHQLDLSVATLTEVNDTAIALDVDAWTSISSYACGCERYIITGGTQSSHNIVFSAFDNGTTFLLLFEDPQYNDFSISSLTSYACCQCYVLSVGSDTYGESNEVFRVHNPQVVANNNCFCVEVNSYPQVLRIFDNDCGCIDTSTTTFYRDEALTDLIGGPTNFTADINPGDGTLSWDQNNGTLTYTPPATIDTLITACFFYTIEDCCNCSDCAKVTIFIKPDSEYLCDLDISAVPSNESCSGDDGQISVTVTGGLGPYDYLISPDPNYQSTTNVAAQNFVFTGLAAGDYLVSVTDLLGCQDWQLVTVGLDNIINIIDPLYDEVALCTTDYPISLLATPASGQWSGTGVTDLDYGMGSFNPGVAGAELHTITYTVGECTRSINACVAVCTSPFPFRVINRGFATVEIQTDATLVACRDAEFCYEVTVTNTDPNQNSGFIEVFGLADPDWTINNILDCTTEPDTAYNNQGGNLWVNTLNNNITFIKDNNFPEGQWNVGVLTPNESICLKICATDPDVGNKTLNIQVVQS